MPRTPSTTMAISTHASTIWCFGRGVILLAICKSGAPLFEYTPNQVKQAVVGYGGADKHQVMEMTRRILKMEKVARPDDAADAIAIALCHARSSTSLLAQKGYR